MILLNILGKASCIDMNNNTYFQIYKLAIQYEVIN
jgi:hypothetical protein